MHEHLQPITWTYCFFASLACSLIGVVILITSAYSIDNHANPIQKNTPAGLFLIIYALIVYISRSRDGKKVLLD